jgi:hypothetical protein
MLNQDLTKSSRPIFSTPSARTRQVGFAPIVLAKAGTSAPQKRTLQK